MMAANITLKQLKMLFTEKIKEHLTFEHLQLTKTTKRNNNPLNNDCLVKIPGFRNTYLSNSRYEKPSISKFLI